MDPLFMEVQKMLHSLMHISKRHPHAQIPHYKYYSVRESVLFPANDFTLLVKAQPAAIHCPPEPAFMWHCCTPPCVRQQLQRGGTHDGGGLGSRIRFKNTHYYDYDDYYCYYYEYAGSKTIESGCIFYIFLLM